MSAQYAIHHTLPHNPTILYTKKKFAPACHLRQKISSTSKCVSNTHLSQSIYLFPHLGLGLRLRLRLRLWLRFQLRLWLHSSQPLACNRYKSLHATTRVAYRFYFWILCKWYHTHKDGGGVRYSYSGFPRWDSFERILNDIPFVNSFLLLYPNMSFEM